MTSGRVSMPAASTGRPPASPRRFARESFAGYVAHELRTPLATQRALLELALGDDDTNAADWREIGKDILDACRQQERLLEACLTLSRSGSGLRRRERVDLAALAAAGLRAHDLSAFETVESFEPAWASGDPELIDRLAANLVANAVHHNVAGGRIEVATRMRSGRALLSVANTGPAVPGDELPRLFEPFQRLASSRGSPRDGVGLGLAIVAAIAGAHGAVVSARARPGGGLAIDVSFPRAPQAVARLPGARRRGAE